MLLLWETGREFQRPIVDGKKELLKQGSRGRRIQRPGTIKLDSGRIKMPRPKSQDADFFSRGTTENCDRNSYCLLGFEV